MIGREELGFKFNNIFKNIDSNKWHYLHKNSIANFIFYLDSINDESRRKEIFLVINDYLDYLNNLGEEVLNINISLSRYLFDNYINRIQDIYVKELGFIYIPSKRTIAFILPFFIIFLYFVDFRIIAISISVIIICIYAVFVSYKYSKNKLYGFDY